MARGKRISVVLTIPETGNSKVVEMSAKEVDSIMKNGIQANNINIPLHMRLAHIFSSEVKSYFKEIEQGSSKEAAFVNAFCFEAKHELIRAAVSAVGRVDCEGRPLIKSKDLNFEKISQQLSSVRRTTDAMKPITNQDMNNEFYTWDGSKRLKSNIQLRVASVRFMQLVWHLFWNEEFQKKCRSIFG